MDLARNQDARSERTTNSGLAVDGAQLEAIRAQTRQAAEQHTATMAANDREMALAELDRALAGATKAQSPEEWDSIMSQTEEGKQYVGAFDKRDMVIAQGLGIKDALSMNAGPEMTGTTQSLMERAQLGNLQPGSPEYQDYMLNGGLERTQQVPSFRMLTPDEAKSANMAVGSQIDEATGRIYPAESKDTTTEGERKAAGFYQRMLEASTTYDQMTASDQRTNMLQNGLAGLGVPEGWVMSDGEEVARQNQIDWVRAKLRAESGAVIGDDEAWEEAATYFPRPGDSAARVKAKRVSRDNGNEQLRLMAGRAAQQDGPAATPPDPGAQAGPPPEIMQQLKDKPPGTQVRGPNGETLTWDGHSLR
jgi:hypothetical protein